MDVVPRLKHAELLIAGLFHCMSALLDRLVENGALERIEIDAALEAVEDNVLTGRYTALCPDDETRRRLALPAHVLRLILPAHVLRLINEYGERSRVITTGELYEILDFDGSS